MDISKTQYRRAFSTWLRTGSWPPEADAIQLKFNPWHDPEDGRFTFVGSGSYHGPGEAGSAGDGSGRSREVIDRGNPWKTRIRPKAGVPRTGQPTRNPGSRGEVEARPMPGDRPSPVGEFVGGVGEGLYGAAEGAVAGAYSALTTNPVTTVRNVGRGIVGMIDAATAAENVPARVQLSRAAEAVANASARDIGRAAGSVAANTALAVAPGAALAKISAVRGLRAARLRPTFDPPQIGWVKETINSDKPWKAYNDSAPGSRPGQAPTLMRTMPDGSKRPVKFDGVQGDYLIDRKWKVVDAPRARAQLLRQSEVLAQHRSISVLEVPTPTQRVKALNLLKKTKITNIRVKVIKP